MLTLGGHPSAVHSIINREVIPSVWPFTTVPASAMIDVVSGIKKTTSMIPRISLVDQNLSDQPEILAAWLTPF